MELFDSHTHLLFGDLGADPEGALDRAREAGVSRALLIGIDLASSAATVAFAERHPGIYAAIGYHPNEAAALGPEAWSELLDLAASPAVVALGETGLDFYWKRVAPEQQARALEWHVRAALERDLPLVLHLRDAYEEAARQLQPWAERGLRAVVHCFGGGPQQIQPFASWGWPISFAGNLTYPRAHALREACAIVPDELLLLETDAPWLAPQPCRGRTNEPAYVVHTAQTAADARGSTLEQIARLTTANACRVFGIDTTAADGTAAGEPGAEPPAPPAG